MPDFEIPENLNELSGYVHAMAKQKGWYDTKRTPLELLCLIHSEVSECCEAFRAGNPKNEKIDGFTDAEIELADIIIRVLDMSAFYGFDISGAIRAKVEYNATRPDRHGGKVY